MIKTKFGYSHFCFFANPSFRWKIKNGIEFDSPFLVLFIDEILIFYRRCFMVPNFMLIVCTFVHSWLSTNIKWEQLWMKTRNMVLQIKSARKCFAADATNIWNTCNVCFSMDWYLWFAGQSFTTTFTFPYTYLLHPLFYFIAKLSLSLRVNL